MIVNILILLVGFVILIYGADIFVDGASSLARNFKLSPMLIGLTIVAFGTSAPEFAVSIQSLIINNGDMILGNVIGSNILNTFLILGVCALIHSLTVKNNTVKKELPIALLLTTLFIVLMSDSYKIDADQDTPIKYTTFKSILLTILGIVGIIMGSRFVVDGASTIAELLGVSQRMISLTIVALGTSLPELATSIAATRKGEYDIAIGNVIGSNIFNIGIVVGLPVALLGGINSITFSYVDLGVLLVASLVLFIFSFNDRKITKPEGIMMLLLFLTYYSYVVFF